MASEPPSSGPKLSVGLMVVGSEMAGFTVVGLVIDLVVGSLPWVTIALTVIGFVVVFVTLVRFSKSMSGKKAP
jgi:F0F1-type ATP synthase assembly protein I